VQNGFTALHTASKKNWLDVADLLLNHAADPNAQSVVSYQSISQSVDHVLARKITQKDSRYLRHCL